MIGGVAACITTLVYLIGSTRAFGYDSAVTVFNFVATPSLLDPFQRQVVFNNHPLFSFAEHLIYGLTGSQAEILMRLLPITAAAVAVGILTAVVARAHTVLSGLTAGLILATNPAFVAVARDARGYSLVVLMVTCACITLTRMQGPSVSPRATAWWGRAYLVTMAVAIGTHLFAIIALPAQVGYLAGRRRLSTMWIMRMFVAACLGCLPYTALFSQMVRNAGARSGIFQLGLPVQAAVDLLGGKFWIVALVVGLALFGATRAQDREPILAAALATAAALAVMWLLAPADLNSRFFVWLVPGIAVLVGVAVAARPALALAAVLVSIAGWAIAVAPGYSRIRWLIAPLRKSLMLPQREVR